MGTAASIVGGIASSKAMKAAQRMYEDRIKDVKAHRDAKYYQDPSESAGNQAALTNAANLMNDQTQAAKASNIISGGSDESVALAKQAAASTVGNMMQQQAGNAEAQKENIWNNADAQIQKNTEAVANMKVEQGKAIAEAAQGVANSANSLGGKLPGQS